MEARGAIMHNGVYGSFGLDGNLETHRMHVKDTWRDTTRALEPTLPGTTRLVGSDYWVERHFLTRAIQNYNGSVHIIHGCKIGM